MKLSVLTAALRGLVPAARRKPTGPEWRRGLISPARSARRTSSCPVPCIRTRATSLRGDARPVANTLDLRKPLDARRVARIELAMRSTDTGLSTAYFDNMLAADPAARRLRHELMIRVFDAAAALGVKACAALSGGTRPRDGPELVMFEEVFVPLLREAKARGLVYRVEQCPMPGWTTLDRCTTTLPMRPGRGLRCTGSARSTASATSSHPLRSFARHPHGPDTRSLFQYLKDEGYAFLIDGFHVKAR